LIRSRTSVLSIALVVAASLALGAQVMAEEGSDPKPLVWPATGRITQPYGCTGFWAEPRYGSCRHFHGGVDIADSRGTPIRAAGDGVISHVGWDPWGTRNWMVMINHGDGLTTWYAHLRGRDIAGIRHGVRVLQGQVIGYMSDTGMATGVHLHWAVLQDGRYVNPRKFVDGKPLKTRKNGAAGSAASCTDIWIAGVDGATTAAVLPGDSGSSVPDVSCAA
jgi:murein DD-endopeptidase MepM/ murein hydrolase activator NlpD